MSSNLEIAKEALEIKNVTLKSSNLKIDDGHEAFEVNAYLKKNGVDEIQSFNNVTKVSFVKFHNKESKKLTQYIFNYSVGIRLLLDESDEAQNDDGLRTLILIEAEFSANYISQEEICDDAVNDFAKNNVGYHVWPYWREYVQSTCSRLGIKNLSLPFYQMQ